MLLIHLMAVQGSENLIHPPLPTSSAAQCDLGDSGKDSLSQPPKSVPLSVLVICKVNSLGKIPFNSVTSHRYTNSSKSRA